MLDVFIDTILDSLKLLPFLFIAYLLMEVIEYKTSDKSKEIIKKSGRFGPIYGAILGIFPQCGFSAIASNLYAGRIIGLGTLIAIFLSTSDEMLPILIAESTPIHIIFKILLIKVVIGIFFGFIINIVVNKFSKEKEQEKIGEICEHEHCHCDKENILKSSVKHTLSILMYITIITFILNTVIYIIGEESLSNLILNKPILGPIISGIIGLIPNCASSVILTRIICRKFNKQCYINFRFISRSRSWNIGII